MPILQNIADAFQTIVTGIIHNSPAVLTMLAILWGIYFFNFIFFKKNLNFLGIYPRSLHGLIGIVFAPFLHDNFEHLLFNSIPFFFLANFLLLSGLREFYIVSATILLISGTILWLFGRKAIHIGSSYLIMGYFGYLLYAAYMERSYLMIGLAAVTLYYCGNLIFSIIPMDKRVSWESHLFGLVAGVLTYWLLARFGVY